MVEQTPAQLQALAEQALRSWSAVWSDFLGGAQREQAEAELASFSDLKLASLGGYPGAERRCLLLQRSEVAQAADTIAPPWLGLELSGNFLFDPTSAAGLRGALEAAGVSGEQIGDVWLRGDRGGQAVVLRTLAERLDGQVLQLGTVELQLRACPLAALHPPQRPQPRRLQSVEASRRLDAIASAGFGLSRGRMVERIRSGAVRVNWESELSPSRELQAGDRVHLEGRGELTIETIEATQRQRWRVSLMRS